MKEEYLYIIVISFILGLASGFVMHRSDFCVAGIMRDIFLFKNHKKVKSLFVLVIVSMTIFEVARLFGLLPLYPFPLLGTPSIGNAIGGFLFGIGMTLAGGCVVGVLYKIGSGKILSVVALIGILFGSGFYAEIHDSWVKILKATTLTKDILLSQLFGISPTVLVLFFALPGFYLIFKWYKDNEFKTSYMPKGYINLTMAAIFIALFGFISYLLIGMPFGITTSYAKLAGIIENILLPEHFQGLKYFQLVTLNYKFPFTGNTLSGGPAPVFDAISAIQMPVIIGIVMGSYISALQLKEFKIFLKVPLRQYLSAFIGGFILGLSSRLAQGCNIWHIFGGLPIFCLQSILFSIAILPGTWLGTKILTRFIIK